MLLKDLRRSLSKEARPRTDARSVLKDGRPELQAPEAREPLLEFHVNCDATRTEGRRGAKPSTTVPCQQCTQI